MSTAIPLLGHASLDAPFAYRPQGAVSVAGFLHDVYRVAEGLPEGRHVLNVCRDRYRFTVALAACLITGRISLLPSTHTPEMVRQLRIFAPDAFCLDDGGDLEIDLPHVAFPETNTTNPTDSTDPTELAAVQSIPSIPADRLVAYVFTSGSTGTPIPHGKHWGSLVKNARAEARSLGLDDGQNPSVVGTVPPQHMYGFESTVLVSLHGGVAAWSGRPFYPADIAAALAAVPRPRVLVTTPFHLRSLLDAEVTIPEIDLVLSATAPLSATLAQAAETRLGARMQEIYGSTETGQIATRTPTASIEWTLMQDIGLETDGDSTWASGGHVEGRILLGDVLEITTANRFLLHGRNADLINIAGKRTSLAYLNHQLTHVPGVIDGCFYMPDDERDDGITRLIACAVAPGLSAADLTRALRQLIDPVFLPRPLLLVESLPRNATGKLPRPALQALLAEHLASRWNGDGMAIEPSGEFFRSAPSDHPAFPGHFPGRPIVPGVLLLDWAIHGICQALGRPEAPCRIAACKFLSPVGPGERLRIAYRREISGSVQFEIGTEQNNARIVATGKLAWSVQEASAR